MSNKQELLQLSKKELQQQYKTAVGKEADQALNKEQLADAILAVGVTQAAQKRAELEGLSDDALDERYIAIFATKGPEMTREQVIDAIMSHSPVPAAPGLSPEKADPSQKGAAKYKDREGREYLVQGSEGMVVVRQANLTLVEGQLLELPNTVQVQTYYPERYEELVRTGFFSQSKMKVEELKKA